MTRPLTSLISGESRLAMIILDTQTGIMVL